ncbi:hypothetical protein LP419_12040 [Massilia sp. H-1]|nr:hypothetical protein LP419_12040 [Massilia sp. H-1]
MVLTADGKAASVVGTVPVATTTSTTALSTSAAPISLSSSMMGSIGGTVVLSLKQARPKPSYVSAKQSFALRPDRDGQVCRCGSADGCLLGQQSADRRAAICRLQRHLAAGLRA